VPRTPATYVLKRIDRELWEAVKARAASEGRPVRYVLIEFLKIYAEHGYVVIETFNGKTKKA
jgi:hypothetical protein